MPEHVERQQSTVNETRGLPGSPSSAGSAQSRVQLDTEKPPVASTPTYNGMHSMVALNHHRFANPSSADHPQQTWAQEGERRTRTPGETYKEVFVHPFSPIIGQDEGGSSERYEDARCGHNDVVGAGNYLYGKEIDALDGGLSIQYERYPLRNFGQHTLFEPTAPTPSNFKLSNPTGERSLPSFFKGSSSFIDPELGNECFPVLGTRLSDRSYDSGIWLPPIPWEHPNVALKVYDADPLSLHSHFWSGPIDSETSNDKQERPRRSLEYVARTDDSWNCRETTESDTQADSSDSSDISEEDKLPETHPFRHHVPTICKAGLAEFWSLVTTASGSETRHAEKGPPFASSGDGSKTQVRHGNSRKRRLSRDANDQEDEDDEPNGKKPTLQRANDEEGSTLACPFYKRNPAKHSNCLHFRLRRIKDVKQHLQRKHKQPHYCPVCGLQFETQASLQAHTRARLCEDVIHAVPEGVSEDQRAKLGDKVSRTQTLTRQWYTIWDILFPDIQQPASPLVESPIHEVLTKFREFWGERGQELISEHLQRTSEISYSVPREERDLNALHTLLLHESMGELINRFMDEFGNPSTPSPIRGVPTPSSYEAVGLQSDDTSDLPFRPDSGNTHSFAKATQSTGRLTMPNLVNDSISDPSTHPSRLANALCMDTIADVDTNDIQQVSSTWPEDLSSLDGTIWTNEWVKRQENKVVEENPIGNSALVDVDFDSFLQGGDDELSEVDASIHLTSW